jgi:hypothetical protein
LLAFTKWQRVSVCVALFTLAAAGQQSDPSADPPADPPDGAAAAVAPIATPTQPEKQDKRIFGVLPNYRTVQSRPDIEPLTTKQKFTIAAKDSFDWPNYLVTAGFAGIYQWENQNPKFGQGAEGYARRYVTALGDQVIGNIMTEGVVPSLLREDPRYYRIGEGSILHRLGYSSTRVFVTHTDSGGQTFNCAEILGNSTAVAISNLYYPQSRGVLDNLQRLGLQVGTDSLANIGKEFWPDIKHKFFQRNKP